MIGPTKAQRQTSPFSDNKHVGKYFRDPYWNQYGSKKRGRSKHSLRRFRNLNGKQFIADVRNIDSNKARAQAKADKMRKVGWNVRTIKTKVQSDFNWSTGYYVGPPGRYRSQPGATVWLNYIYNPNATKYARKFGRIYNHTEKERQRVLVGCESSGTVRDAFLAAGHDAWSCDITPPDSPSPRHIQDDVLKVIANSDWDIAILHPPCTYLTSSGLHWNQRPGYEDRAAKTEEALEFVQELLDADVNEICLENPVGCISTRIRKPDQYVQPHQFGHDASKRTGLWLKNLPLLEPTANVEPRMVDGLPRWANQDDKGRGLLWPSKDRSKIRSLTYDGIAAAMAQQWGVPEGYVLYQTEQPYGFGNYGPAPKNEVLDLFSGITPPKLYEKKYVDSSGLKCPYPVLQAKQALAEMDSGEELVLVATDWEAEHDVPMLAKRYGHELRSVSKNQETGEITFKIVKG
jgi:TusA-related sulfurtransferase